MTEAEGVSPVNTAISVGEATPRNANNAAELNEQPRMARLSLSGESDERPRTNLG